MLERLSKGDVESPQTPLRADRAALDATQALRLIGSPHSGSRLIVETLTSAGEVWEFATLACEVTPLTRAEVVDLRIQRAARDAERSRRSQRRPMAAQGFNAGTLWEARLSDLQALVNCVRWFGELPGEQRDYWMFLAANAMSWLAPLERLEREAHTLVRDVCHWMTGRPGAACTQSSSGRWWLQGNGARSFLRHARPRPRDRAKLGPATSWSVQGRGRVAMAKASTSAGTPRGGVAVHRECTGSAPPIEVAKRLGRGGPVCA
jgi:hypothetical protein